MRSICDHKTQYLVTLARGGDDSALNQLCNVYGERVRRIIRLRMGSELRSQLDSMDLVQDVLVNALQGLGSFTYKNEGTGNDVWPFDKPHYLILNAAIGGSWGGSKGIDDGIFPQKYYIDYVRVYESRTAAGKR